MPHKDGNISALFFKLYICSADSCILPGIISCRCRGYHYYAVSSINLCHMSHFWKTEMEKKKKKKMAKYWHFHVMQPDSDMSAVLRFGNAPGH